MSSPVAYFTKEQLVGQLNDVIQNIKTEAEFLMTFTPTLWLDVWSPCFSPALLASSTRVLTKSGSGEQFILLIVAFTPYGKFD